MILTTCAACAAPLAHDAPRCIRCKTRYCNKTCQHDHWRRGHKQICKKIHRGGNAEQYYADKKYKEAVADAVEACADDTKGQTCYICTQALHWKTKEGLVRGCACRGTAGFAHVSCLAEQAKILVAEALENNWDDDRFNPRWKRWDHCGLCDQNYHGIVRCALGWACWKTYVDRPEADWARGAAMNLLGLGLQDARHDADALSVQEAQLSMLQRQGASEQDILVVQGNIASACDALGRLNDALRMQRLVYSGTLRLLGEGHRETVREACNYAISLLMGRRFGEVKSFLGPKLSLARRVLGENDNQVLRITSVYAVALFMDADASLDDLRESVETLEGTKRTARQVLGSAHPLFGLIERDLQGARAALAARERKIEQSPS